MKIITSTDPDLEYRNEYDLFRDVYFKGEPFTGIIKDEDSYSEQTEFLNGKANGQYICKFKSGETHSVAHYQNGEEIWSKSYYESGHLYEVSDQEQSKLWSESGQLAYEWDLKADIRKTYFKDGQLKSLSRNITTEYYAQDGALAMIFPPDKYIDLHYVRKIDYKDEVLLRNYSDLLNKEFPGLEKLSQTYRSLENHCRHLIWMWFWEIFDKDQRQYFTIINNLMKHPDKDVVDSIAGIIAIHRFEPYIEKENAENAACYKLIKKHRKYQDQNFPDR